MNGAVITDAAENFNRLAEHIDGLDPGQVETELGAMLDDGVHRNQNPLLHMIVSQEAQRADTTASPALKVLESVESAIDRTPDEKVRSTLGGMAVEVVSQALTYRDFLPGSYTYVTQLAERAERFTTLQTDPKGKVYSLIELAQNLGRADLSETDIERSVFWRTSDYLSQAHKLIEDIEDPTDRFHAHQRLAEQAADSLHQARFDLDGGDELLAERLTDQPVLFFEDASLAAEDIQDPEDRAKLRAELVYSMVVGMPRVEPVELDPALFGELTSLALKETDAQLRDYREGDLSSLEPMDKVRGLSALGEQLANGVMRSYRQSGEQHDRLIAKTVEVFEAARDTAEQIQLPDPPSILRQQWMADTGHAVKTAERFAELDFDATKELLQIGFELAVMRDAGILRTTAKDSIYYIGRVSNSADEIAVKGKDGNKALELYSLIHRLESERIGPGNDSMILEHNANHMRSVGRRLSFPDEKLKLDESGTELIEYIIRNADNTIGCLEDLPELQKLLGDYPALQWAIQRHLQDVAIDALAEQEPKSQTARLAREVADSL